MYRGISDFKNGYQPRNNIVKVESGDFVQETHNILARCMSHFSQFFNVHGVNDVKHTEIHTAEPLVSKPSAFEFELVTEMLKRHKSPGIDQVPVELITARGTTIRYETHKLLFLFEIIRN